ncbi:MAG: beta strand repeat-containing protein [Ramlibacter sp.]
MRKLLGRCLLLFAMLLSLPALGQVCAIPGKDGPATLSGVVNTWYPGTANALAGATTINVGTARGATALASGDLVLVIQMQDGVNAANFGATLPGYGNAASTAGTYEYAFVLTFAGNVITLSAPLVNSYRNAQTAGAARQTFQVVRVPQYSAATIPAANTVTPLPWDGTSGGIVAFDVAGTLDLSGTINASGYGFRGGAGRVLGGGGSNANTAVRFSSSQNNGAMKGEGTAGSPRNTYASIGGTYTWAGAGGDFYPNGDNGYGAPGNAGGGGNDGDVGGNAENSGGGGGGNAGAGGQGGNTWNSNLNLGGRGGQAFVPAANRIAMGGGGGAGASNNGGANHATFSGASGGGAVLLRAGAFSGGGTINVAGANAPTPVSTCCDDGGTGGGGGGSAVLLAADSAGLAGITVNARGGNGSPTPTGSVDHGPGGGGGGGAILASGAVGGASSVAGGTRGATTWNAADGSAGALLTAQSLTGGDGARAGASCLPTPVVTKITTTPARTLPTNTTAQYRVRIEVPSTSGGITGVAVRDELPDPFLLSGATAPAELLLALGPAAAAATGTSTVQLGTPGGTTANSYTIGPGGAVTLTFNVTLEGAIPATYQNPALAIYSDPVRTVATGTASTAYDPASATDEDVVVSGALSSVTSFATLCPAGVSQEITATNYISNADFSDTSASPGAGAGVGWAALNTQPANNNVAYQLGLQSDTGGAPDLYQSPFPGNPARDIAGSNTWLFANGNSTGGTAADRIWWSQTVTGLEAGRTYTFIVHASSPVSGNQNGGNAQRPNLRLQVTQAAVQNFTLGVVLNDTAAADNWRLYQASFVATQTTATLEINNTVVANAGERRGMFALAQPTLRLCAPIVNVQVAKTNLVSSVVAGGTTAYQITVANYGPGEADGSVLTDAPTTGLECTQVQCTGTAGGATCPAVGTGPGELDPDNLLVPGDGVVLPSLPANSTVTLVLRCEVEATGE